MDMAVLSLSSSLSPDLGDNVAGCGVAPVIDHSATKAATVRLRSDWPRLRPGILMEMIFQIRAENFGPLAERVFHCVGDDGWGTGMSAITPKADINGYGVGCLLLTRSGHRGRRNRSSQKATIRISGLHGTGPRFSGLPGLILKVPRIRLPSAHQYSYSSPFLK